MARKMIDCRKMPSEQRCDLTMIGSEEHLLPAAVNHAVTKHGHEDTTELREEIKKMFEDDPDGQ